MQLGFWAINFSNVLTLISLLLAFYLAWKSNKKRLEDSVSRLAKMEFKLDLLYEWFEHNVVGRGERHRGRHSDDE